MKYIWFKSLSTFLVFMLAVISRSTFVIKVDTVLFLLGDF